MTRIGNLLEPRRNREIGSLRSWNIRQLRERRGNHYLCRKLEISWTQDVSGDRKIPEIPEIEKYGRLGDTGDPKLTSQGEIVICGTSGKRWRKERMESRRIGKSGGLGNSGGWKIREIWRFRRWGDSGNLGNSENWEIRKSGRFDKLEKIIYVVKKKGTSWNPKRPGKLGDRGDYEDSVDSRGSGNSGTSEGSGCRESGKFAKLGKIFLCGEK